uniref:colipase-like protein 2 n=1 Tax=Nyctereutes procyonoides TaxID=34880 RepID=UPI0002256097|nr:colipase-like protein 2 [Nyctereutes procyonoides]
MALVLLAGVLLPCPGEFLPFKKRFMKGPSNVPGPPSPSHAARELVAPELSPQVNGVECSHHSECVSDCCLMNLDHGGAFCAPKARIAMLCLFQTKGALNVICPCQSGLSCISKDPICSRRCHLI